MLRLALVWGCWALIGWQATVAAIGEVFAASARKPLAAAIDPLGGGSGAAWAVARLTAGDMPAASAAATQVLRITPINQQALTVLALAGPADRASGLMTVAALLGWRTPLAQLWLAQAGLVAHQPDLFATRTDAFARSAPDPAPVFALVDQAIHQPAMRAATAQRLALFPDWRGAYLARFDNSDPNAAADRTALLDTLAASHAGPTRPELLVYVGQLEHFGREADARAAWTRFAARPELWAGRLYDGGFTRVGDSSTTFPFEWTTRDSPGGSAWIEPAGGKPGLLVHNDGSAAGSLVVQLLALAPGHYRLVTDAAPEAGSGAIAMPGGDGAGAAAFRWSITCAGGGTSLADSLAAAALDVHAGPASYAFTVPPGCASQSIALTGVPGLTGNATDMRIRSARIDPATQR